MSYEQACRKIPKFCAWKFEKGYAMNPSRLFYAFALCLFAGCAPVQPQYQPQLRYESLRGATLDQFLRDRYACYQETAQRVSGAAITPYGGAATSNVIPSCSAFSACLAARGYLRNDAGGSLVVPPGAVLQCSN